MFSRYFLLIWLMILCLIWILLVVMLMYRRCRFVSVFRSVVRVGRFCCVMYY